ncbi:uncharacterized protein LOC8084237 isoform X3 [Sorghum bicolor]|uniref:uncharacterized protein LOC8084237 isoform X3 n=1 Tax=Sorghum bicolor TaxID=4558 RepID=UPI000B425221|nr:uncharacterized protein LOC8084237 isoform X3 [Sorghum bicolor]|eukprot:XP_021301369.1 uncharacterized protein LOC8084237 isoform X3 [Sorghum bicolor]
MEDDDGRVALFALEIKVEGFCSIDSVGRKAYTKGRVLKWDVELGLFSFEQLMTRLNNAVNWSPSQYAVLWFPDKRLSKDVRLENQLKMDEMFDMYKDQMKCQIIVGVFDNSVSHVDEFDEFDDLEPLSFLSPEMCNGSLQLSNLIPNPAVHSANQPSSSNPNVPLEAEVLPQLEPDREPDMFDNTEEYVGYDDEAMYMTLSPTQPSSSAAPSSNPPPSHVHVYENADAILDETEVTDADPEEIHVIHDPENPKIVKGELFPDIVSFRKSIRHHAVKKGFVLTGIKTDKTRFLAKCKADGCPWRIHASRLYDNKTIQKIRWPLRTGVQIGYQIG